MITKTFGRITTDGAISSDLWVISGDTVSTPAGWSDITGQPGMPCKGATLVNGAWVAPTPPVVVPASITNFQCRAVLMATADPADATKTLFDIVDAQITAMAKTSSAYQAWEYANDVTRNGALVTQMAASLGLTSAQVDQMFVTAAGISA